MKLCLFAVVSTGILCAQSTTTEFRTDINGNRVATSDQLQRLSDLDAVRRSIVDWIGSSGTEPVEKLIIEDAISDGVTDIGQAH